MKKNIIAILFAAIALSGFTATAQDTVQKPLDYYYYSWPQDPDTLSCIEKYGVVFISRIARVQDFTKECYTDQPLSVYGIAVAALIAGTPCDTDVFSMGYIRYIEDTSHYNSHEFLRLYKRSGVGDELAVIAEDTLRGTDTAAHYLYFGQHLDYRQVTMKPRRIFEKYFDNPVTVTDTFYVGITENMQFYHWDPVDSVDKTPSWIIEPIRLTINNPYDDPICDRDMGFDECWTLNLRDFGWVRQWSGEYLFVLPILNPDSIYSPTDTILGADTVEIGALGVNRYVNLYPNPASGSTMITASFGMSRIEVFDPSGRCVYDKLASGLSAILDISHWPADVYMVNIYTPLGRVTKRLVVR